VICSFKSSSKVSTLMRALVLILKQGNPCLIRSRNLIAETTWTFYAEEKNQEIPTEEPEGPKDPPDKPTDPDEPEQPEEPTDPEEPENPEEPIDPEEPEKPREPPLIPIEPAPKTGDERAAPYQILFITAGAAMLVLLITNWKDRKDG